MSVYRYYLELEQGIQLWYQRGGLDIRNKSVMFLILIITLFILLQRTHLFQMKTLKIMSELCGILICIMLSVLLLFLGINDKVEVCIKMPSIKIMQDYLETAQVDGKDFSERNLLDENSSLKDNINTYINIDEDIKEHEENYIEGATDTQEKGIPIIQHLKDKLNHKIMVFLQFVVIMLIICLLYRYFLFPRYCNIIEKQFGGYGHILMGENTLEDILISVSVIREGNAKKNNFCDYIRKEIYYKNSGIYYIVGQAGEGKTVALMQLALMLVKERKRNIFDKRQRIKKIPIFLSIPEIESFEDEKFEEHMFKQIIEINLNGRWKTLAKRLYVWMKKYFFYYLKSGKCIILLDGYDEINENKRYDFTCLMDKMENKYANCIFIISSRTYVFNEDKNKISNIRNILNLSLLDKAQIYEFVNRWSFEKKEANYLYHQIITNPQLGHLASNALILTLICYMYDKDVQVIHNSIVDFYFEATNCLLKTWEEDKKIQKRIQFSLEVKQEALSELAYYQLNHPKTWFSKMEIIEAIKECANRNGVLADSILQEISLQAGIIDSTANGKYRFYHRSFYEFYAALYFLNNDINLDILEQDVELHCNILFFYLSMKKDRRLTTAILQRHKDKSKFVSQIIRYCDVEDEDFIWYHVNTRLKLIEKNTTDVYKAVGELARRYPYIRETVKDRMLWIYNRNKSSLPGKNSFITLTYFENSIFLAQFLTNNFLPQEIVDIILMSDDTIDRVIYNLVDDDLGLYHMQEIFNGIASTYKYDLLFRIMIGSKKDIIKELIMGSFLHCTNNYVFLEWLEDKELLKYENEKVVDWVNIYSQKYKWCNNKFSTAMIKNFYVLIWYAIKLLDNTKYQFVCEKIDNGIKFLITYVKNLENQEKIENYLVDMQNFDLVSLVEFDYHWKRANKIELKDLNKDPVFMNKVVLLAVVIANCILMFYYLFRTVNLPILSNVRYGLKAIMPTSFFTNNEDFIDGDIIFLQISRFLKFNSFYFLFAVVLNITQNLIHKWLTEIPFRKYCLVYHILTALLICNIYYLLVQEVNFRYIYGGLVFIIMLVGVVLHKNNYPAFKNPLFTKIRQYLN